MCQNKILSATSLLKILWICHVWPEPTSTAAGVRTLSLMQACTQAGYDVHVSSACQENSFKESLENLGFKTYIYQPNDSKFDEFIINLNPSIVIFDRFILEEQFSWRVKQCCPKALRVLDTVDLHSLRRIRESKVKDNADALNLNISDFQNDDFYREISSIYRSDLSLIISDYELRLLKVQFNVPDFLLQNIGLLYDSPKDFLAFEERKNFVMIGNFNHKPNIDGFRLLVTELWDKIYKNLEQKGIHDVELHIYGAYPTHEFLNQKITKKIKILGWTQDALSTISKYKVNLAPLRFGAGLKGKIADGWFVGTPCIATYIAAEGMYPAMEFGGFVADDYDVFGTAAAELYYDNVLWKTAQIRGQDIINKLFLKENIQKVFIKKIGEALKNIETYRTKNIIGQLLWYQGNRSTEFFSRWIEAKNHKLVAERQES